MDTVTAEQRGAGSARTPGRPVRGAGRKALLVLHILAVGSWIGIDVLVAVLVVTGWTADDRAIEALAYRALGSFVLWPMLVAGVVALVSGVLLGLRTRYGLVRYWWVAVKLAINVVLCVLIAVLLRPDLAELAAYGDALASGRTEARDMSGLIFPPAVSLTALTLATVLSVVKPWGRIARRRRR